ncbi:MAG: DNA adenine methylase [Planctomycetota bacterium]|jgi:adenine-specific DNA methylase
MQRDIESATVRATAQPATTPPFPATRYQGSKRKFASAIVESVKGLDFSTVLDAFGGTGVVAHAFKACGKSVTYNDVLSFNHQIGTALIENDESRLSANDVDMIIEGRRGGSFIQDTFDDIYFTAEENRWLDRAVPAVEGIANRHARAIAWYALFQAAMAKRPYNLFHRANLYMRTADVQRSFGNKASWDRSFADHFRNFVAQANHAVFTGEQPCQARCGDVLEIEGRFDLVYVDPPYINSAGVGVDYRDFYHFLEGMVNYDAWGKQVDHTSKHRRLLRRPDPWTNAATCLDSFERLVHRFKESILVISYRDDGIPCIADLVGLLSRHKNDVRVIDGTRNQYALSKRRKTRETLLIAN